MTKNWIVRAFLIAGLISAAACVTTMPGEFLGDASIDQVVVKCQNGDMSACRLAGNRYQYGNDAPRDILLAAQYHQMACQGGEDYSCEAIYKIALDLKRGKKMPKDLPRAIELFESACQAGYGPACTSLAHCYRDATGVPKNMGKAKALYIKGCENGSAYGCRYAGKALSKTSPAEARAFYEKGCGWDDAEACAALGLDYLEGRGVEKDCAKAREYLLKSCDGAPSNNASQGCLALGRMYETGQCQGVDMPQAVRYYRQACYVSRPKQAEACLRLAHVLQAGRGIEKDANGAHEYYRQACDLGSQPGCIGMKRDECKRLKIPGACRWLKQHGVK